MAVSMWVEHQIPLTCPHNVGMLAMISYTVMVNAYEWVMMSATMKYIYALTVYFVMILHE